MKLRYRTENGLLVAEFWRENRCVFWFSMNRTVLAKHVEEMALVLEELKLESHSVPVSTGHREAGPAHGGPGAASDTGAAWQGFGSGPSSSGGGGGGYGAV